MGDQSLGGFLDGWKSSCPGDVVELGDGFDVDALTAVALEFERRGEFPVLVASKPVGFDMPVVANLFASWDRVAGVLGVDRSGFNEAWLSGERNPVPPTVVSGGPVHDVVLRGADVDAGALPIPEHFATDAGRYVSAGILVANDPDTGIRNLSFQRMQLKGPNRFGVSLHSRGHIWDFLRRAEARDEPLEVAVVVGAHPAVVMAATARLGIDVDEYDIAGGLLGEPLELVGAVTIGVDVPAHAEIVIEGRILPHVREPEGPFGEYPGYSSFRSTENVFEVTAITHGANAMFLDIVPGNAADHLVLATCFREPHLFERVREVVPTLKDLHLPKSGTTFHCFFSMDKTAEGMARSAMSLIFGMEPNIKLVVACDADIDVRDPEQVLWAVATRMQADLDVFIVPKVFCNELDPSQRNGMSARMGIDATTPDYWEAARCLVSDQAADTARAIADPTLN